ncbi:MAG: hypothetical protein DWQ04_32955 [Chloroflexi bacterium]|nr:MAG: hypothetical protein DWQ04_32955 [Chloroflexota bacterium]
MLAIEKVDTGNKSQVQRFIDLHYRLYQSCPQWVPPFRSDIALMLNRRKHPFYEHSMGTAYCKPVLNTSR